MFFSYTPRIPKEKQFKTAQLAEDANGREREDRILTCPRCHSYINLGNQSEKEDK